jgi:hypothetical protein
MAKSEHPLAALNDFLPPGTFELVAAYLHQYNVHLTITRQRRSVLGDYRNAVHGRNHRISVNGNLNQYSFLITLLHELAHLLTFDAYGHRVQAHGKEWKLMYSQLLAKFVEQHIFPVAIEKALISSIENPKASSCAEEGLMRVLREYDEQKENSLLIEQVPHNELFMAHDGRIFKKGEKLRKRYKCQEMATRRFYLFSALYEVRLVAPQHPSAS